MKKNVAGQVVGAQLVSATDGSAFTGSVTVAVTIDGGTQATGTVGSGACAHKGNGYHTYAPAQAETNGDLVAFTFTGTGAVPVTVQAYTSFPQTGDAFVRLGAPAGASVSADIAAIEAQTDDIGVAGAGLTAVPWNAAWDAEVQSEAADALNAYDPPTNAEMVARTLVAASYGTAANQVTILTNQGTLNTAIGTVDTVVDAILADTGTDGVVVAAASKTDYALSTAGVDAILDEVVEGTFTLRQLTRLVAAALVGELSGAATTTITIRDASDTKTRVTATVDADGNRSALTLDAT